MASGPTFTRRKGRGFPGLLSNALQPLSKASSSDSGGSHGSARLSTRWGNRTSKKFGAVKEKNSNTQQGLASAPKEENDSSSGQVARDPKGAAAAAASSGQHGLIELCILDGLNLPLQKDQKAFFLIDFDSEFSKTPYASIPEDGKPLWNHTSTHDVAIDGGKMLLYLYLVGTQQQETLLGTAQIRLADRLEDNKSETHWLSFSSKSTDELDPGCIRVTTTYHKPKTSRIGPKDFKIVKVLGKGSFGTVYQVRKQESGRSYAMKVLSKTDIAKRKMSPHVLSERKILQMTHLAAASPYLCCLKFSFQTKNHLYLIMDLVRGGELFSHLQREGGRLNEDRVRFYTAEIVLALQTLHKNKVVYRDLKPENILLDEAGHIVLCDFGLAKLLENKNKTRTFCGTPEYCPPEMIIDSDTGYDYLVDWWSLGCLIFELICGFTPFYSEDNMDKYAKIVKADLRIPKRGFSPVVSDLIERLLNREPERRLGARGAEEVKAHPFFDSIDWKAMAEQRVEPPFKPTIESDPPQDVQFGEEGPPSALVPFVDKTSSQDRGQRPHQSRRSSCEERSLDESEQEADQHLWRNFTFAHPTPSSRASLASTRHTQDDLPSKVPLSPNALNSAFDQEVPSSQHDSHMNGHCNA